MTALTSQDVEAFNAAVLALHATATMGEFSGRINDATRAVMTGDICAVNWIDRRAQTALTTFYHPAAPVSEEINTVAQTLLTMQTPFWLHCADEPQAASDSMSRAEWTRRDIHWACRQVDKEEFICFDVPLTSTLMLTLAEMRGGFGRYSSAERLKMKLLGPHVRQVYHRLAAQTGIAMPGQRNLRAAQVNVSRAGRRYEWPEEARKLLADYGIVVLGDLLPDVVRDWFVARRRALEKPSGALKGPTPLRLRRERRELCVHLMRSPRTDGYLLVLQERERQDESAALFQGFGLSAREREVLLWLAQGKSNSEIAIILGVSPGTVARHLESIYPKLGLENRYAAGLMASRLLAESVSAGVPGKSPVGLVN